MSEKKTGKETRRKSGPPAGNKTGRCLQNDERIFREGRAIFSENELGELINTVYAAYGYRGGQLDKMKRLIDFLADEDNRFGLPEMIEHSRRLSGFMETFRDFLSQNFQPGEPADDGDIIFQFRPSETSYETEAFLSEFQIISLDIESAYRNYRNAASMSFNIQPA